MSKIIFFDGAEIPVETCGTVGRLLMIRLPKQFTIPEAVRAFDGRSANIIFEYGEDQSATYIGYSKIARVFIDQGDGACEIWLSKDDADG